MQTRSGWESGVLAWLYVLDGPFRKVGLTGLLPCLCRGARGVELDQGGAGGNARERLPTVHGAWVTVTSYIVG